MTNSDIPDLSPACKMLVRLAGSPMLVEQTPALPQIGPDLMLRCFEFETVMYDEGASKPDPNQHSIGDCVWYGSVLACVQELANALVTARRELAEVRGGRQ